MHTSFEGSVVNCSIRYWAIKIVNKQNNVVLLIKKLTHLLI